LGPFEGAAKGSGFEGTLATCGFSNTSTDTFKANKTSVQFSGLDPRLIGATVTLTGTFSGIAVVLPGL